MKPGRNLWLEQLQVLAWDAVVDGQQKAATVEQWVYVEAQSVGEHPRMVGRALDDDRAGRVRWIVVVDRGKSAGARMVKVVSSEQSYWAQYFGVGPILAEMAGVALC